MTRYELGWTVLAVSLFWLAIGLVISVASATRATRFRNRELRRLRRYAEQDSELMKKIFG